MVALDFLAGVTSWTVSVQIGFLAAAHVKVTALTGSSFCPVLNNSNNSLLSDFKYSNSSKNLPEGKSG